MILMYIFETYLDLQQHAAHKLTTLPKPLLGVVSKEKFDKARAYSLDKSYFHFVHEAFTILMDSMILFFGVLPWFWKRSGDVVLYMGFNAENEILHTLAFLGGVMIWSQITDLPFSLYSTFVIEARHGFNKQTIWLFFRDMLKGICLSILLGPPIVAAIIVIVQLPEGGLREKIESLASSLKFPLKKLFVVDGSTRSSHSNRKSQRNSESRSKLKTLHTSGFRSFAAQFSIMQADEQQAPPSQPDLYRQRHYSNKKNKWVTDHAEETHRRMEEALSQPEINSPVAEQRVIENLLGKRVTNRQGYRSRGPSSSSTGIIMSSEMSTLQQQLADSLKAQEELREELRRQYEDSQKQMQDQAAMQAQMQSQIQLLLSRVGMDGSGSSER